MHVKDPLLSVVRVGLCVPLAGFCLSLFGMHVLNRDVNVIQTNKQTNKQNHLDLNTLCLYHTCKVQLKPVGNQIVYVVCRVNGAHVDRRGGHNEGGGAVGGVWGHFMGRTMYMSPQ